MNKSTKIWLNYILGGIISAVLLWSIYLQVKKQLASVDASVWQQTGPDIFIWLCILLMPVNLLLETRKWHILANSAEPLSFRQAFTSYLGGLAFSMITPNRIGEYPGRILYLKRKNTFRLISVSVLGAVAQLLTVFIFGMAGLIYYNVAFPGPFEKTVLLGCVLVTAGIALVFWRFETWMPLLENIRWMRKFNIYGQLLKRFSAREQWTILGISLLRYGVFTAQYLFFLRWMNVYMPLAEGYCMAALFFWAIGVIPSIALAELSERGQVSLYLFHHFSPNTLGILGATLGIWLLNLIIPSIVGSILLLRMRLLR
ncbi:MAG: lysylphosphatidylglycerol synthase transmembrane domain-containing protein [Flavipsychrobacter sp.]